MEGAQERNLLARANAAYVRVDADPTGFSATAAALVDESRRAGHVEALVVSLRAQAWAERARLADTRARLLLNEAARLARRHGLLESLGQVLVTRAAVNHELGRLPAAQRDLDMAAELVSRGTAQDHNLQQAALHQNVGRLSDAANIYRRLLARTDLPIEVRGKVSNNLALIEARRGAFDSAFLLLDDAAQAAAEGSPALAAFVVENRGWVSVQAGRLPEGLRLFDEASQLLDAAGLPLGEFYTSYSDACRDLRLLPEAVTAATRAVEELQSSGVPLMAADAQLRLAHLALLSGDGSSSTAAVEAERMFRRQRRPAWGARAALVAVESHIVGQDAGPTELSIVRRAAETLHRAGMRAEAVHAHLVAGRLAATLGRRPAAVQSLDRAELLARGAPILVRLDGRVGAALSAQLRGDDPLTLRQCRAGLRDLARHRTALPSMELRALASGHGVELGRLGLEVSLRTRSPSLVLDWLERTRAAALSTVEPPPQEGLGEEMGLLRAVHADLAEAQASGADQTALLARQRELERRIRRASWVVHQAGAAGEDTTTPARLRRALGERVLVEYGVHAGVLFAVVLTPRRSRLVMLGSLATVETHLQTVMFALRRLARPRFAASASAARLSADAALRRLAEVLLAPLGLDPRAGLVVVPLRGLHRLPWAALHGGPLTLAPSASFWLRTTAAPTAIDGPTVLVAGPDLECAQQEIDVVRRLYRDPVVLTPPESTAEAVAAALAGAALAHLACHGDLRADNPSFSALRMSDGPLTVHELERSGTAPRRILLASCESGADATYEGDEMVGFVSALMARGTAGMIASTVVVSDRATVDLMYAVHGELQREATLTEALHRARGSLDRDDPQAFASWCAFNAYGAA